MKKINNKSKKIKKGRKKVLTKGGGCDSIEKLSGEASKKGLDKQGSGMI